MDGAETSSDPRQTDEEGVSRRRMLGAGLASTAGLLLPSAYDLNAARTQAQPRDGAGSPPPDTPMTYERLVAFAASQAERAYTPTPEDLPPDLAALSYDAYQAIRFRPERTIRLGRLFSLQLFHRGFLHRKRAQITLQSQAEPGRARTLAYDPALFDLGTTLRERTYPAGLGYAGFRLGVAFDPARPDVQEEFVVFLGASYFRLRGRDQFYGLSARGAALNTFAPGGEEFPDFEAFWIEEPAGDETSITVLALLDGPSLSGAYRFRIEPGEPARMSVSASLHPRRRIERLGLAPLTSMFLHGQNGPGAHGAKPIDDYRPQVHDSDGLLVASPGDRLWRPLTNGRPVSQISAFRTEPLEGFGLLQRERRYGAYLDPQARHEDRPGLWVTPGQDGRAFAAGTVQLFEIPTIEEYTDNIVAAFVPDTPVEPGRPIALDYTLTTVGREPNAVLPDRLARVVSTRIGSAEQLRPSNPPDPRRRLYAIDFEGGPLPSDPMAQIDVMLSASAGSFVEPYAARVPQTGGWRLYAEYRPPDPLPTGDVVLRARLSHAGKVISETWDAAAS